MLKKWTIYNHLTILHLLYKAFSDTSDRYSDSDDSFFVCELQEQVAASMPKTRLYTDLSVSTSVYTNLFTSDAD